MSFKPVIFLAFANDKVDNAQYLRNLSLEQRGIRTALSEAVSKGLCEVIERSSSTISDIIDVFQDPGAKRSHIKKAWCRSLQGRKILN